MKTLFLLRHAEALPDDGSGDFARKLSAKGTEAARGLGRIMKERGYVPAFVMCSSAIRTAKTLEAVMESITPGKAEHDMAVYNAAAGEALKIVKAFDDKYDSAMIVGHNPSIHELAAHLADDASPLFEELTHGYPPGTLSVFECPRASWADIQGGENKLKDLI